jgi:hypothetical protein
MPDLTGLGNLQISYQEVERFFGSIRSTGTDFSCYAMEFGQINGDGQLSFRLSMYGVNYSFSGSVDVDNQRITGTWNSDIPGSEDGNWEDGNWSAQAQGAGEEEEGRRRKPARRTSR